MWLENSNPVLQDVTIRDCASFSLSTDLASAPSLERLTLAETKTARRWEIRESRLEGNAKRTLSKIDIIGNNLSLEPKTDPDFSGLDRT